MATEYVLIRDDNKEMFNLGKNPQGIGFSWFDIPKFYGAKYEERNSKDDWEWKDNIAKFTIDELYMLKEYMIQPYSEEDHELIPYYTEIFDKLIAWADGKDVYIGHDEMEHDLLKQGYKVTASRYK